MLVDFNFCGLNALFYDLSISVLNAGVGKVKMV